jgi:hypothetical protein
MPIGRRRNDAPQDTVFSADPQDLHWAMHAVVKARSRQEYDAMPMPRTTKAPVFKEWTERPPPRTSARKKEAETVPIFGPLKPITQEGTV